MANDTMQILKMLEEGKITAEEAARMMSGGAQANRHNSQQFDYEKFEQDEKFGFEKQASQGEKEPKSIMQNWIEDFREAALEVCRSVRDTVEEEASDWDWFGIGTKTEKQREELVVCLGDREIHTIIIDGFNAPIQVATFDKRGNDSSNAELLIDAIAKVSGKHATRSKEIELKIEDGIMRLVYDEKAFKAVGVKLNLPREANLGALALKTRRAPITVDGIKLNTLEAETKAYPVKIKNCYGRRLAAVTKSAAIVLENIYMADVQVQTKNAKIILDDVGYKSGNDTLCRIVAETTNAAIISKPAAGFDYKLNAQTTNAKIAVDIKGLNFSVSERSTVEAQSYGYELSPMKMEMDLITTNAKIVVK